MIAARRVRPTFRLAFTAALLGAAVHPSPKVELVKRADYIQHTLAGATQYFVRTVDIGKQDLAAIRQKGDFTPDDPDVQFYLGQTAGRAPVGVVLFHQVDTPHGPLEVGLTFSPDGAIARAAVTTCTVETKPWVLEAVGTGLMDTFTGMKQGDDPRKALATVQGKLGGMPEYMAELIATAVGQGMVLYGTLYKGSAS
jgi:hypothetical protein